MDYPQRLIDLYAELGRFTWALCAEKGCPTDRPPQKCCLSNYCKVAGKIAERAGVVVAPSTNPVSVEIPYLDRDKGCLIPPHLRPVCTRFQCRWLYYIQSANVKDRSLPVPKEWVDEYDRIIREINALERSMDRR